MIESHDVDKLIDLCLLVQKQKLISVRTRHSIVILAILPCVIIALQLIGFILYVENGFPVKFKYKIVIPVTRES